MFNYQMAPMTESNQVGKSIGIHVLFYSKLSEWSNVMHVMFLPSFFFCHTTVLTFITITVASISALLKPVWAVIREWTTFPTRIVFAAKTSEAIHGATFERTTNTSVGMRLFDLKFLMANWAYFLYPLLKQGFFSTYLWAGNAFKGLGKIFAKTFLRTKMMFGLFVILKCFEKALTASFAFYRNRMFAFPKYTKVIDCIYRGTTLARAVFTRPTLVIPKFFTARRTFGNYSSINTLALARTMIFYSALITRGKIRKFFMTYWTNGGLHMFYLLVFYIIVPQKQEVCYGC